MEGWRVVLLSLLSLVSGQGGETDCLLDNESCLMTKDTLLATTSPLWRSAPAFAQKIAQNCLSPVAGPFPTLKKKAIHSPHSVFFSNLAKRGWHVQGALQVWY